MRPGLTGTEALAAPLECPWMMLECREWTVPEEHLQEKIAGEDSCWTCRQMAGWQRRLFLLLRAGAGCAAIAALVRAGTGGVAAVEVAGAMSAVEVEAPLAARAAGEALNDGWRGVGLPPSIVVFGQVHETGHNRKTAASFRPL